MTPSFEAARKSGSGVLVRTINGVVDTGDPFQIDDRRVAQRTGRVAVVMFSGDFANFHERTSEAHHECTVGRYGGIDHRKGHVTPSANHSEKRENRASVDDTGAIDRTNRSTSDST